jgi:hypothetical protein
VATAFGIKSSAPPRLPLSAQNNSLALLARDHRVAKFVDRIADNRPIPQADWDSAVASLNEACDDLIAGAFGDLAKIASDWIGLSDRNGFHLMVRFSVGADGEDEPRLFSGFMFDADEEVRRQRWEALGFYITAIDGLRAAVIGQLVTMERFS